MERRIPRELTELSQAWEKKIELAKQDKDKKFGADAREVMRFYEGPHDFIYTPAEGRTSAFLIGGSGIAPQTAFKVTVNKTSEYVQLFLPTLYHRNPDRVVEPKQYGIMDQLIMAVGYGPPDPIQRSRRDLKAALVEWYLNYTPNELDLKAHGRKATFEALTKGRGCMWTQLVPTYSGRIMVGSFYDSVDNLLSDPDSTSWRAGAWIARRRYLPVWEVERMFGYPQGSLKGTSLSYNAQSEEYAVTNEMDSAVKEGGKTADCIEFYEIYSRMGLGGLLKGVSKEMRDGLSHFGDFCYLAIAPGLGYPLNLPPTVLDMPDAHREIFDRTRWPIPFYEDATDPWPCSVLDFQLSDNCSWPVPPLKAALGYQEFLDWAYSFLSSRIKNASRTIYIIPDSLPQEFKDALLTGDDMTLIELQHKYAEVYSKLVDYIQQPDMGQDMWRILQLIEEGFEKASGLNELMYAQSGRQMRSASEAELKREMANIRPDDMAEHVENFMTMVARKEALVIQTVLSGSDVAPIFGEHDQQLPLPGGQMMTQPSRIAQIWDDVVKTDNFSAAAQEYDYRVEAGSIRKPNKAKQEQDFMEASQLIVPMLMKIYEATGNPEPINEYLRMWHEQRGMEQTIFMPDMRQMQAPQQPGMPPQGPQGPAPQMGMM